MTRTSFRRALRNMSDALDRILQGGVPMDATVAAGVAQAMQKSGPSTPDLLNQAASLIAAMAPGSAHAESAAFLIPELQCRADVLRYADRVTEYVVVAPDVAAAGRWLEHHRAMQPAPHR